MIDQEDATEPQATDSDVLSAVHMRAMKRFDTCYSATMDMRESSLIARRFVTIPGAQWDGPWGEQFANSIKVEVNKVGRGVDKIEMDYRENRIAPDFRPDGDQADEETAATLDGMYRADFNRFKSQQALDNAAIEAISGGFGAFRLLNEWDDEGDRDNDYQRVNPASLIVDADQSVFFDLNARQYDKADARFCFVRTAMTRDAFEEEFGEDCVASFPDTAKWVCKDWFQPDTVGVVEYYEVEEVAETLHILSYDLSKEERRIWASDLAPGELAELKGDGWQSRQQRRKRRKVRKYILSGAEVLEDRGYIAGQCIPIVPVYGKRAFVDNIERWKGYVHDKMDAQRLYNSNVSRLAETNSIAPIEVPIFDPAQIDNEIAALWNNANVNRSQYLLAHSLLNPDGSFAHMGPIGYRKPPDLAPVTAALLQIANQDLTEDQVDGAGEVRANTSAEAMDIAATRVDAKSGIYLDNIRQSVQRAGEIYLSMAQEVYADKGRKVETQTEEGGEGVAELKQMAEGGKTINDFTNARYKVIVSVSEATTTRRDKTVKSMLATAEVAIRAQDIETAQAALLTAVLNQDGEGIDDFHKWARKRALNIGLVEPTDEEARTAEEAQANAEPDPMGEVAKAEAIRLQTEALHNQAQIKETEANAALKRAQTIETLGKVGMAGVTNNGTE